MEDYLKIYTKNNFNIFNNILYMCKTKKLINC